MYKALYEAGFASQPTSVRRDDGLMLSGAYISATARCAPPDNKPLPSELANCEPYFVSELEILKPRAILALGGIAMRAYLGVLKRRGAIANLARFPFSHGADFAFEGGLPRLFASYHPSQQNTFTGRLTEEMLFDVLAKIRAFLKGARDPAALSLRCGFRASRRIQVVVRCVANGHHSRPLCADLRACD